MNNNEFLIIEKYKIAFKLDGGVVLGYDTKNGEINLDSQGIMRVVSPEIATEIEEYFKVNLEEYGVKIVDEVIDIMPSNITRNTHG